MEVRAQFAHKIARLVHDMNSEERERIGTLALETLETLARDQLPRVRAIVAEEVKSASGAPAILNLGLRLIPLAPVMEYLVFRVQADV